MKKTIGYGVWLVGLASLALWVACSDDETDGGGTEEAYDAAEFEEHGCGHLQFGPDGAAEAAADASATPLPDISSTMTRIAVTLVPVDGGNGGFVQFATTVDGVHALFLDVDVPIEVTDASGAVVTPVETRRGTADCTEVAVGYFLELTAGTYVVEIGPTSETSIQIVPVQPLDGEHMDMDGSGMDMDGSGMDMDGSGMDGMGS